jgi:N-acetyltransferase
MAIAGEEVKANGGNNDGADKENLGLEGDLVVVDSGTGLFCHPDPLPTPMGIPRLFVPSTYRRRGIANALLDAAAANFIHGCTLDPRKGQVAFTQPTGDGKALMVKWGGGGVRIYEE